MSSAGIGVTIGSLAHQQPPSGWQIIGDRQRGQIDCIDLNITGSF